VLFDLQSGKRRRVVQIVFGGLAVLFAVGFVFFGVGTGGGGGIADLVGSGGGNGDASSAFDEEIEAAEARLQANPNDTAALSELVTLHFQAGRQAVDENGALTTDGEEELRLGADAWNKYVKATKNNVDAGVATIAFQTFDALGATSFEDARVSTSSSEALTAVNAAIADWEAAAETNRILVERQPTSANYTRLAYYLYLSGQTQAADQAAEQAKKAKGGNPADVDAQTQQAKALGTQLQAAIKQLTKQQQATGGGATGGGENPLGGLGGGLGGSGSLGQ
jgi:tetratricopeptide (TPR) repeat protein